LLRRSVHLYIPDGAMKEIFLKYSNAIKIVSAIVMIAGCGSCQFRKNKEQKKVNYTGFYEKSIYLTSYYPIDSFGTLTSKILSRLDTFYQWHNFSDCNGCGSYMYRFAGQSYSLLRESGWTYLKEPDSIYQLTISFRDGRDWPDSLYRELLPRDTVRLIGYVESNDFSKNTIQWIHKYKFEVINGRPFIVGSYKTSSLYRKDEIKLLLAAITRVRKREIIILAECDAKDTTGFIDNMCKSLLSIRIEEK
jgi:hypothetical protein